SEQMIRVKDEVFISNPSSNKLYVLDLLSMSLSDSIETGFASYALSLDEYGKIWVGCKGDQALGEKAFLDCIDPVNHQRLHHFELGDEAILDVYCANGQVYWIQDNKLQATSSTSPSLPGNSLYTSGSNLYAVEVYDQKIYLCDAIDFVQKGEVLILYPDGTVFHRFRAGRIPNGFLFIP
ncbi:MAG: hypothetical protein LPK45_04095, partial [Bacteroidota bacterium]|nr:hypothetical protein [Bacteroidota bacterium]MDX5430234.1 hypothetical protein [Bacteroidota bacterium]MDX5468995.1 hypothetical protein [Bacteroidota bacterium]